MGGKNRIPPINILKLFLKLLFFNGNYIGFDPEYV